MIKEINGRDYMTSCDLKDLSTNASDGRYKIKHDIGCWDERDNYIKEEFITDTSIEVRGGWICYKDLLNACIEITHAQGRSHTFIEGIEFRDNYFHVFLGT